MRILFVLPAYEPAWAFGGVVRCTANLCRGLAAQGHVVTVYTINANGRGGVLDVSLKAPTQQDGVEVYYFPSTFGPASIWDSRALVQRLRENIGHYDIAYVSAVWQWLGRETTKICAASGVPCIFGVHGSLDGRLWKRHRLRKMMYWHTVLRRTLSGASALHFTTEYERRESKEINNSSFIVPNGLDMGKFKRINASAAVREKYHIPSNAPVALSVGRVDPKKRTDLLISALAQAAGVHLIIVGPDDAPLAQDYKAQSVKLGVDQRVTWTGYKTGTELLELYSAADVFVLPSEDENFGMAVLEAMACGTPILVSPYVGVWHEVKDAGVGMEVDLDSGAMAQALRSLIFEPGKWANLGSNARRTVQYRFAVDKVAKLMGDAFRDVLTASKSPQCSWKEPAQRLQTGSREN